MKYMGSKARIAKYLVPIIQGYIDRSTNKRYIEPFVGGANIIDKIQRCHRTGFDKNEYIIALFRHLQKGGELPGEITREEYGKVRAGRYEFDPWHVGCAGFLASYNGRFFDGGYAGIVHTNTPYMHIDFNIDLSHFNIELQCA